MVVKSFAASSLASQAMRAVSLVIGDYACPIYSYDEVLVKEPVGLELFLSDQCLYKAADKFLCLLYFKLTVE